MGRKYKNPPIIEALCEFRFEPGEEWDITFPGLFYEKVKDDFPKKRVSRRMQIRAIPVAEESYIQQEIIGFIQFLREDGKALVQIAPNLLSVNHLKPYPTWNEFRPIILDNLGKYKEVANPKGVMRIGLRYINQIELPMESVELKEFFNFYPHLGGELPQEHGSFVVGVQLMYENERDVLKLELASAGVEREGGLAKRLDLDYSQSFFAKESEKGSKPDEISMDDIEGWIEVAHTRVEETFEACITDKLRKLFEEVQG